MKREEYYEEKINEQGKKQSQIHKNLFVRCNSSLEEWYLKKSMRDKLQTSHIIKFILNSDQLTHWHSPTTILTQRQKMINQFISPPLLTCQHGLAPALE